LPMSAHAAVAFMAAARLGAISVPLFSGFGADAIAQRLNHSGAKALITVGAMTRRGQSVAVGATVEQALKDVAHPVDVIVADDHPGTYASWSDAIAHAKPVHDPVRVEADAPLLLVYTSGTTGAPKGAVLTHCGFAAKLSLDVRLCLDLKTADRWLWMSDFGWIIGPIMIASALMTGATLVLAQGAPDYPSPDRFWRLIEDHKVSFLGLAPTLIRGEMAKRELNLREIDLTSLRVVVSSGEPWTHSAWRWCFEQVCNETAPILNWSGGTEISGGILTGTVIEPVKPLAFSTAVPGMGVDVYNGEGSSAAPGEIGELVLTNPSMGLTRGLWDDDQRFLDAYWTDFPDVWKHGDLASRDQDGFFHLHGRSDDVLKIGGKRTGPSEVEDLLVATQLVSDAAVVGLSDDRAGQAIACVCVRADDGAPDEDVSQRLSAAIVDGLGRPYRPKLIGFVDELPKTRSGKVIRRLVSAVLAGRPAGDVSSLANPRSLDAIKALANLSP
ncbi:MAG: AMP-binding protein, partial [Pseudomonadota bacterium]